MQELEDIKDAPFARYAGDSAVEDEYVKRAVREPCESR
jgi:hypothetical protein